MVSYMAERGEELLCEDQLAGDPFLPAAVFGGGGGFVRGRAPGLRFPDYGHGASGCDLRPSDNIEMPKHARQDSLDLAIENALAPGEFIAWDMGMGFVEDRRRVEAEIDSLVATHPKRAVRL